jgi:hypothetical protein
VHPEFVWFPSLRFPAWGLARIHRGKLLLALLDVPKATRRAIHFNGIVVSRLRGRSRPRLGVASRAARVGAAKARLNRAASASLPAARLGWLTQILHSELARHGRHADDPHPQ